jgi:pilus assembly protein CpaB
MTRRILSIVVAIVLAALGTGGLLLYASAADERARAGIEGVTVAIADKRIPVGTSGERIKAGDMVRFEQMPRASVPTDALAEIGEDLESAVLTSAVEPGQLLLKAMFGRSSTVTSGLNLPEGTMAVTVETGAPEQVAGYVRPGARIAIFLTYKVLDKDLEETNVQRTRVLLPNVEVLSTGTYRPPARNGNNGDSLPGETTSSPSSNGSMLVTVAVTQTDAERLIAGLNTGKLYLGLLTDSIEVNPGPGVENVDAGGGLNPLFG